MNRGLTIRQIVYSAASSMVIQLVAMLALTKEAYGLFSIFFLIAALGISLSLSIIAEPWLRTDLDERADWRTYSFMLLLISVASLGPGVIISVSRGNAVELWFYTLAVGLTVYRAGARFYALAQNENRWVGPADATCALLAMGAYFLLRDLLDPGIAVASAWLISAIAAACLSKPLTPKLIFRHSARTWVSAHSKSIKSLLIDSTLLDVSTIFFPLAIAPLLGIASFGVYRGVTSAALPVRLILNAIRPSVGRASTKRVLSKSTLLVIFTGAIVLALGAFVALSATAMLEWLDHSVLSELSEYSLPVAVFVGSNFIGNFYYIVARNHATHRVLMTYRISATLLATALPLIGILSGGLVGAIWGLAMSSFLLAAFLLLLLFGKPSNLPGSATTASL